MTITSTFEYINHRGERAWRTINVDSVEWVSNPMPPYQPGWFISGWCHDRQARRSFALSRIILDNIVSTEGAQGFMRLFHITE